MAVIVLYFLVLYFSTWLNQVWHIWVCGIVVENKNFELWVTKLNKNVNADHLACISSICQMESVITWLVMQNTSAKFAVNHFTRKLCSCFASFFFFYSFPVLSFSLFILLSSSRDYSSLVFYLTMWTYLYFAIPCHLMSTDLNKPNIDRRDV